jgi:hypothetical protein
MSHPSPRPVTALRARMIEDMMVRGFTEETRTDYVRHVRAFAAFIRRPPDTATAEDLRRFQLHQRQSGMQPPSINNSVSALRFFFTATLDRPDLARRLTVVREPLRLPSVLSVEEVTLLLHPRESVRAPVWIERCRGQQNQKMRHYNSPTTSRERCRGQQCAASALRAAVVCHCHSAPCHYQIGLVVVNHRAAVTGVEAAGFARARTATALRVTTR